MYELFIFLVAFINFCIQFAYMYAYLKLFNGYV